jgi:hypothetical protein
MEGGTWDSYMLAHKAPTLLESEPLTAGHALLKEWRVIPERLADGTLREGQPLNPTRFSLQFGRQSACPRSAG